MWRSSYGVIDHVKERERQKANEDRVQNPLHIASNKALLDVLSRWNMHYKRPQMCDAHSHYEQRLPRTYVSLATFWSDRWDKSNGWQNLAITWLHHDRASIGIDNPLYFSVPVLCALECLNYDICILCTDQSVIEGTVAQRRLRVGIQDIFSPTALICSKLMLKS